MRGIGRRLATGGAPLLVLLSEAAAEPHVGAAEGLTADGLAAPLALQLVIAVAAGAVLSRQPTRVAAYGIGGLVLGGASGIFAGEAGVAVASGVAGAIAALIGLGAALPLALDRAQAAILFLMAGFVAALGPNAAGGTATTLIALGGIAAAARFVLAAVFRRFGAIPIAVVGTWMAAIGIMTAALEG